MTLTNGAGYTISTQEATKGGTGNGDFAYDTLSGTAPTHYTKYYQNGVLKYTSLAYNSGTYYPSQTCYAGNTKTEQSVMTPSSGSVTFTIKQFTTTSDQGYWCLGINTNTSAPPANAPTQTFYIDSPTDPAMSIHIRENAVNVFQFVSPTLSLDDTFKIEWAGEVPPSPSHGTRLPPPPLIARF